ncbi:MAG: zinc-ribbon domain-containing protein [Bifidobacterium tibiigranuli]|uniref:zinc ribbon domain-containing protein n=1 Tax=Bifidobacterium tibiigranuli TaxID=2172043 RepID=UPI0023545FF5|nr:zinc-ribbon domain-containing protein [Bifidobacterium tibiigranuli]MCH3975867.1 zinc-ribbon domain-containing protein [Bifidobacterium tibiigranuli]MCH4190093.1 zinc-ribbon domain-containing protein [Bifidobacterium tibiigranuli]MCH4203152.1 zinc-ribbon domain-containing protein [Bifidobacterium tibiigranuli]MCH4274699.1 zinc-ribbon domain-containing protein [Bifidobacterium tibiigranuli]
MFCSQCGTKLNDNAKFCSRCGQRVIQVAPLQTPAPVTAVQPTAAPVAGVSQTVPVTAQINQTAAPAPTGQAAPSVNLAASATPVTPVQVPAMPAAAVPTPAPTAPATTAPTPAAVPPATSAAAPNPTAAPANPITSNPLIGRLFNPASLKTMLVSLGTGLGAALAVGLVAALCISIVIPPSSWLPALSSSNSSVSYALDGSDAYIAMPNFVQILVAIVIAGLSGSFSVQASGPVGSNNAYVSLQQLGVHTSIWLPVGLSGLALLIGAAFGSYMLARKREAPVQVRWDGAISAAIIGLGSGLVLLILGALFPLSIKGSANQFSASGALNGASLRTFAMGFLLAGIGALIGYAMAQFAPDSSNIALALWRWTHRTRGFVRTVVESFAIYWLVFTVIGVVVFIWLIVQTHQPKLFLLLFLLFPYLPVALFVLAAFGTIAYSGYGPALNFSLFGFAKPAGSSTSIDSSPAVAVGWQLWLLFLAFVLATIVIVLRTSLRNMQDPWYAAWKHTWKSPVAVGVLWIVFTVIMSFGASLSFNGFSGALSSILSNYDLTSEIHPYHFSIAIAAWFFIIAGLWAFIIEALAMRVGPTVIASMPGMGKFLAGGYVQPTPAQIAARAKAGASSVAQR